MTSSALTLSGSASELLVHGFVHEYVNIYRYQAIKSLFPVELNKIIFLYFYSQPRDTWDPNCHCLKFHIIDGKEGEEQKKTIDMRMNSYQSLICNNNNSDIDENGAMITVGDADDFYGCFGSAYLKNIVHEGKHDWKFRIEDRIVGWWFFIGIWKVNSGQMIVDGLFNNQSVNNSYAFSATCALIVDPMDPNQHSWKGRETTAKQYGIECKKGDIIDMHLDFYERTLGYSINGKNYGVAFSDIEETYYRAVVGLYYITDRVRLLSYKHVVF